MFCLLKELLLYKYHIYFHLIFGTAWCQVPEIFRWLMIVISGLFFSCDVKWPLFASKIIHRGLSMVVESTILKFSIARKIKSSTSFDNLRPMCFLVTWLLSLPSPQKNKKNLTNLILTILWAKGSEIQLAVSRCILQSSQNLMIEKNFWNRYIMLYIGWLFCNPTKFIKIHLQKLSKLWYTTPTRRR